MFFALKKIVSGFIQPSSLILFLVLFGIYLHFGTRRKRCGLVFLLLAFAIYLFSVFNWMPNHLLRRLERQYPPYVHAEPEPRWLLVLGHGFGGEPGIPDSSRIDGAMHARLSEALYIMRGSDDMKMTASIAGPDDPVLKHEWWDSWCESVQLPQERTVLITEAVDTRSEIQQALVHMGEERFVLVTSAAHMPRAMRIAAEAGGNPVAAPCDYLVLAPRSYYGAFIPSARNMHKLEQALHEYVGIAWHAITQPFNRVSD